MIKIAFLAAGIIFLSGCPFNSEDKNCSAFLQKYFAETDFSLADHIKKYPFPVDPTQVTLEYDGSNAEYLIYKSTPKPEAIDMAAYENLFKTEQDALNLSLATNNEQLESELKKANLQWLKIPKTLYDILYWSFRVSSALTLYDKIMADPTISQDEKDEFLSNGGFPEKYTKLDNKPWSPCQVTVNFGEKDRVVTKDLLIAGINTKYCISRNILANYALNNYIFNFINNKKELNISPKHTLSYAAYLKLFEDALENIQQLSEKNHEKLGLVLSAYGTTLSLFLLYPNDKKYSRIKDVLKYSLWLEYSLPKDIYLLYRGADTSKDAVFKDGKPNSLSYGTSWLASIDTDQTATAIDYLKDYNDAQIIAVPLKNKLANSLLFLLPYSGISKFRLKGEYNHARSKIFDPGMSSTIGGIVHSDPKTVPFMHTDYDLFKNKEDFVNDMKCYFEIDRHSILKIVND